MNILGLFTASKNNYQDLIYAASRDDVDEFIRLYDICKSLKDENVKYTIVTHAIYNQSLAMLFTLKKLKFTFSDIVMTTVIVNDLSISLKWLIDEIKPLDHWDYVVKRVIECGSVKCFFVLIPNSNRSFICKDGLSRNMLALTLINGKMDMANVLIKIKQNNDIIDDISESDRKCIKTIYGELIGILSNPDF